MAITEKYVSSAGGGSHDGSSSANAFSWAEMITDINAGSKAGNRYNVIQGGGAISRTTTADTISGSGSSTSPIIIRGYSSTITDGYLGRTSSNGALITTNMPSITYSGTGKLNVSGNWIILESLGISGTQNGIGVAIANANAITRCVLSSSRTGGTCYTLQVNGSSCYAYDNDISFTSGTPAAAVNLVNGGRAIANRITSSNLGVEITSGTGAVVLDNLIYASVGYGISKSIAGAMVLLYGNTVVGGSSDGINIVTSSTTLDAVLNNMITDNGAYGINGVAAGNAIFAAHNRTRDNTSGATNSATDWLAATKYSHVTTDTGGPETDYTNSGSNDYTLISASPAKGVGEPFA